MLCSSISSSFVQCATQTQIADILGTTEFSEGVATYPIKLVVHSVPNLGGTEWSFWLGICSGNGTACTSLNSFCIPFAYISWLLFSNSARESIVRQIAPITARDITLGHNTKMTSVVFSSDANNF